MAGFRIDNRIGKIFFNNIPFVSGSIQQINNDNQPVMTNEDFIIIAATGLGNAAKTLPNIDDARGCVFIFKKSTSDGNTFTISAAANNVIDGSPTYVIPGGSKGTLCIVAPPSGTNWCILFTK